MGVLVLDFKLVFVHLPSANSHKLILFYNMCFVFCSVLLLAANPCYFLFLDKKKVTKEPSPKGELANTFKK
jgi:hypothetical protein